MSDNPDMIKYYEKIGLDYKEDYIKRYLDINKTKGFEDLGKWVEELVHEFIPVIPKQIINAEDSYQKMNRQYKKYMWNIVLSWEIKGFIVREKALQNTPYFLKIENINGVLKIRPIFNLKTVNELYPVKDSKKFFTKTIEDLETVCSLCNKFAYIMDITAAYNQMKMPDGVSIGFVCNGVYFRFVILPFGWSLAPLIFNAIMRKIIINLSIEFIGIGLVNFYDDVLITHNDKSVVLAAVNYISYYFTINIKKSGFQNGEFKFVGYYVNLNLGFIYCKTKVKKINPKRELISAKRAGKGSYNWTRMFVKEGSMQWIEIIDQCKTIPEIEGALKDMFESIKNDKLYLPKKRWAVKIFCDACQYSYGFVVKSEDLKFTFCRKCWKNDATPNTNEFNAIVKAAKWANAKGRLWVTSCIIYTDSAVAISNVKLPKFQLKVMGSIVKNSKIPNEFRIFTRVEKVPRELVNEADALLRPSKLQLQKYGYMNLTSAPSKSKMLEVVISEEEMQKKLDQFNSKYDENGMLITDKKLIAKNKRNIKLKRKNNNVENNIVNKE